MLKLGKTPAAPRSKDFRFADFAKDVSLPSRPKAFGHGLLYTDWGMLGNGPDDSVAPGFGGAGDCVLAGGCRETRAVNRVVSKVELPFTGREAIQAYSDVTGYVIGNPDSDNGTDMGQAAEFRRKVGIADANGTRHQIAAWARLTPGDFEEMLVATWIFLTVGIGFMFPRSAWQQFDAGEAWDYDPALDNTYEGGHYVSRTGHLRVTSWGKAIEMTQSFYERNCDEAIVYLTHEQMRANAKDVHGFDLEKLQTYLDQLGRP